MGIGYDKKILEIIEKRFNFIDMLPIAASIIDYDSKVIIKYNKLMVDILNCKDNETLELDSGVEFSGVEFSGENGTNSLPIIGGSRILSKITIVWVKNHNSLIPLSARYNEFVIEGKKFLLCTHSNIVSSIFSESSEVKEDLSLEQQYLSDTYLFIYSIFEDFPVMFMIIDHDKGDILYANKISKKIIDIALEGTNFFKLLNLDVNEHVQNLGKINYEFEISYGNMWLKISFGTSFPMNGRPVNFIVGVDITETKNSQKILIENATIDGMTEIFNRQAGMDSLHEYINLVKRDKLSIFTIVYLDINDLKYVNDTFGHSGGDDYIKTVVYVIKNAIRQTDIFARMGGDEFLIIFPRCIYEVVDNIMQTVVKKLDFINLTGDKSFDSSISYGIMEINFQCHLDVEYILNAVDSKMYYMKEEFKKNRVLPI